MINIWKNRNWSPMLLKEIDKPFNNKDYIYEMKFDGIRAIIFSNPKSVYIMSRNNKDLTSLYPELQEIKNIVKENVIFDGEIIMTDNGYPSFSKLQNRSHLKNKKIILKESLNNPVNFIAFDILYENKDLRNKSLLERKEILSKYPDNEVFIKTKYIKKDGVKLFKNIKKMNLEGIVAKNINSPYHINKRTNDFIKIKNIKDKEFYIGGYIEKENNSLSLLLGEYKNNKLYYVGKVTMNKKKDKYKKIIKVKKDKNKFEDCNEDAIFIKPTITCTVTFLERTSKNHLRHPVFKY